MVTKFLLLFWDTSTMAYKRLLLDLQVLEKHSFLYLLAAWSCQGRAPLEAHEVVMVPDLEGMSQLGNVSLRS